MTNLNVFQIQQLFLNIIQIISLIFYSILLNNIFKTKKMIIEERQNLNVRNYLLYTHCTFTITCLFTNKTKFSNKGCFI